MKKITNDVYLFKDTCHVYVLRNGNQALLIDFGSGEVTKHLEEIGVDQVTDIFITHHHRDQVQGLHEVDDSIRIWVPHMEYDLFANINDHWQARELYNNYNVRQDRFSILESVRVYGTLKDYSTHQYGPFQIEIRPTPGHTVGSIALLAKGNEELLAFTGDLISHPGKIWSLAATQWTYNGAEGVAASIFSLMDLKSHYPDMLLPSHGVLMDDPENAIHLLIKNLQDLLKIRNQYQDLTELYEEPYESITEHVLINRTCNANSYVVLSESGKALIIDYGYDFMVGLAAGFDRSSRRPWLYTIPHLKKKYGVTKIDVVLPTHFHDDHVAGFNLLREIEGTTVWAAENFADILERPERYDLPCLWYDSIKVDKTLPVNQKVQWEEYELTLYEQPGHTLYAVAIAFKADGQQFLAIGDQQENEGHLWNYVYKNKFQIDDYIKSADLYLRLRPDIILSGHWPPLKVKPGYLEMLKKRGSALARVHHALLPLDEINFNAEGFCAWIHPYQLFASPGERVEIQVEVLNPFQSEEKTVITLITPEDWGMTVQEETTFMGPLQKRRFSFTLQMPQKGTARRERITVDVTIGDYRLGQQAEALVTIQ